MKIRGCPEQVFGDLEAGRGLGFSISLPSVVFRFLSTVVSISLVKSITSALLVFLSGLLEREATRTASSDEISPSSEDDLACKHVL